MAADQRLHGGAQQLVPSHQTQSSRLPFQRISDHHAVLYRRQAPLAPFLIPPKTAENPQKGKKEGSRFHPPKPAVILSGFVVPLFQALITGPQMRVALGTSKPDTRRETGHCSKPASLHRKST